MVEGSFCPVNLGESLKIQVVWYVMLCHWLNSSHCFEGSQGLHPQGQAMQEEWFFFVCLILKIHLLRSFEMSGITVSTAKYHLPKYLQLQQDYCENLIWHRIISVYVSPSCSLILLTLTQMEIACSWHITSTKIAQQVNFVSYAFAYLPNGCMASLSVPLVACQPYIERVSI